MEQLQNYIDAIVRTDWVTTAISAVVILAITAVVARLTRRFLGRVLAINEERDLSSHKKLGYSLSGRSASGCSHNGS